MRAEGGRVALLDAHLDRLAGASAALDLSPMPSRGEARSAVAAALAAAGDGPRRVRLTATPRPTLLVEVTPEEPLPAAPRAVRAATARGAWSPGNADAEYKSLCYAPARRAQRLATGAGADHALLLDAAGRLGEAAMCNAFCALGDEVVTAPVTGLLPGIARARVLEAVRVREQAPSEAAWRAAAEIVLTNAVAGALAVVEVDGAPVGDGRPGALAHRLHGILRDALGAAAEPG
jgi:branched-subunit amino acid aminotransferase/4-amino-4-deoxychorismate lyase